jgi:hypothetical protein
MTPKMLREALCVAQTALYEHAEQGKVPSWVANIQEVINELDRTMTVTITIVIQLDKDVNK